MVLDIIAGIISQAAQINNMLALGLLFVLVFVAYRVFRVAVKAVMTGVLAALVPVAAYVLGVDIGVPLNLSSMTTFAVFGISAYMLYSALSGGIKVARFITKPFFGKPQQKTVMVKEREED